MPRKTEKQKYKRLNFNQNCWANCQTPHLGEFLVLQNLKYCLLTRITGSCILKAFLVQYRWYYRSTCLSSVRFGPNVNGELASVGWHTLFKLVDYQLQLLVGMSVNTQPTPRPLCCDQQSVGRVLVDWWWYMFNLNHSLSEMAAVRLLANSLYHLIMLICWKRKDAVQTVIISNTYLMQLGFWISTE